MPQTPNTALATDLATMVHVALAGASGSLGAPVLQALLRAKFSVTALTRTSSKIAPCPGLTVKPVAYSSVNELAAALRGVDVVVSCLSTSMIGSQNTLIDAAVAAGVRRFIPAEFGMDSRNPNCMALPGVCAPKVATQQYLLAKHAQNPGFTYTSIVNGLFLDWGIETGVIIDPKTHTATLYNDGNAKFSVTLLDDIAQAVVGVIDNLERTQNRVMYVHSAVTTQNKLIGYAVEKDGVQWTTSSKDTQQLYRECLPVVERGTGKDLESSILGLSVVGTMDPEFGGDLSDRLDNDLLGVKTLDEEGVRAVVQRLMG